MLHKKRVALIMGDCSPIYQLYGTATNRTICFVFVQAEGLPVSLKAPLLATDQKGFAGSEKWPTHPLKKPLRQPSAKKHPPLVPHLPATATFLLNI